MHVVSLPPSLSLSISLSLSLGLSFSLSDTLSELENFMDEIIFLYYYILYTCTCSSNRCHEESYCHGNRLLPGHTHPPSPDSAFLGEPLHQVSHILQQNEPWLPILCLPHSPGGSEATLFTHGGEEIEQSSAGQFPWMVRDPILLGT